MPWIGNGNISVRKHHLDLGIILFFKNWTPGELPVDKDKGQTFH